MSSLLGQLPPHDSAPLDRWIVDQAIAWHAQLTFGEPTGQDLAHFRAWLSAHSDHARAWQRIESLHGALSQSAGALAPQAAHQAMLSTDRQARNRSRRRYLKLLVGGGLTGLVLNDLRQHQPIPYWLAASLADTHTNIGEQLRRQLPDGTELLLNTATAIDIKLEADSLHVLLRSGEIKVRHLEPTRTRLSVSTPEGLLQADGACLYLRRDSSGESAGLSQLAVTEGTVRVEPAEARSAGNTTVSAGHKLRFSRTALGEPQPIHGSELDWSNGLLSAQAMPLDRFIAELARYHRSPLSCDAAVAQLRVTGVWPITGPAASERILQSLVRELPVRLHRTLGYWTSVLPA